MPDVELTILIRCAEARLIAAGIDDPAPDARILAAHALGLDRVHLITHADRVLTEEELERIELLIGRRARHEPVDRIVGAREFWSLNFSLNEATLAPRPESETIVEAALQMISSRGDKKLRILDLGTGTGCLLLSLLHELPDATGLGVDCAARAVRQARENAERLGLAVRGEFRVNNWANGLEERFDLIVSNPPYIAQGEIPKLMPEVRDHDPLLALDGGKDGLDAYRLLIPQLPCLLKSNGAAVFEIGIGQGDAVRALFEISGFTDIVTHRDVAGIERCIAARKAA
jgi:release factor glutamine methyltransferase